MSVFDELVVAASDLGVLSRSVNQGEDLISRGYISLILGGSVALHVPRSERLAMIAGPGDVFGAESLAGLPAPLKGVWMTPGRVLEVAAVELCHEQEPVRLLRWLAEVSNRAQEALAHEVECRLTHDITARLANLLSILSRQSHRNVIEITQLDIAELLGVQRTSINASLSGLKQDGMARSIRCRVQIRDIAALQARACGCGSRHSFEGQELFSPMGLRWSKDGTVASALESKSGSFTTDHSEEGLT